VLAGDTLALADATVVRLAGIAAPSAPPKLSEEARWALEDLVTGADLRLLPTGAGPDRYGRRAGYLFAGGALAQLAMVSAGFAYARWLPGEEACLADLVVAERAPRLERKGIWRAEEFAAVDATDPSLRQRTGHFAFVAGRVISVNPGERLIFVDFGRNYLQDFTILISATVAEQMATAGVPAESLAGKAVLVRGIIENSGGPAIRVNDAAEILLLGE
jgi:hypothetical protein